MAIVWIVKVHALCYELGNELSLPKCVTKLAPLIIPFSESRRILSDSIARCSFGSLACRFFEEEAWTCVKSLHL